MKIYIKSIPHKSQRYETVGDYERVGDIDYIRVSELGNPDYEFMVAIHEAIEMYLTQRRGISEESITKFDMDFEMSRQDGNSSEPGDHPNAPYRKEHRFAENVERLLCQELGIHWDEYNNEINKL